MKKMLVLLVSSLLALPALAQVGSISGFVYDASTSQPIAGAYVVASGPGWGADSTCQFGGYQITCLTPGIYHVEASAPGFEPGYRCSVIVHPGQNTPNINFYLVPTGAQCGSISGFVYDANTSQPIACAHVIARGPGWGEDYTCQFGGYQIIHLNPGLYRVEASAAGYEPAYRCSVIVNAGQNTPGINFYLYPSGGTPTGISGKVTNAHNNHPILGALVVATNSSGGGQDNTDIHGQYFIQDLDPGYYYVTASAIGFEPAVYPDSVYVVSGHITPNINFALVPVDTTGLGGISGHITDTTNGAPISNAHVHATGPEGQGQAHSYPCGFYQIKDLPAGKYEVRACASGYYPETYFDSVLVNAGQITQNIDFALTPSDTGGIAGFIIDGENGLSIPGAQITATGPSGVIQVVSNNNGDYLVDYLIHGIYHIDILASGYEPVSYPEAILVLEGWITSFICPVLYPITTVNEQDANNLNRISAYPNPFTKKINIRYTIYDARCRIYNIKIYDATGRLVRQWDYESATQFGAMRLSDKVVWDGKDELKRELSPGIYFIRLETQDYKETKTVVLLK